MSVGGDKAPRDLTADGGLEFDDRGQFQLKGVPGSRTLYALRARR